MILDNDDSIKPYLLNQINLYGRNIRFIQILSDIFRVKILQEFGGIYVDCDTFSIKPFDDSNDEFCVMSYQENSRQPHVDNYFFKVNRGNNLFFPIEANIKNNNVHLYVDNTNRHSIEYVKRKMMFFNKNLKINDFDICNSFYIEHYPSQNWKNNSYKIQLCKYDFDDKFKRMHQ